MNLDRITKNVFHKAVAVEMEAPARIVTRQSQLMRSALALIKIFFGNQQDFREGVNKIKMLMSQGMTGIETTGMTPEQIEEAAGIVAKNIWVRFNNAIPNDIQFRVAVMKQALHHLIGALFGAEAFKRNVFSMLERKLGIDIEELGYTGDAKDELFSSLYMALRQAIKAAAPAAVGKVSSDWGEKKIQSLMEAINTIKSDLNVTSPYKIKDILVKERGFMPRDVDEAMNRLKVMNGLSRKEIINAIINNTTLYRVGDLDHLPNDELITRYYKFVGKVSSEKHLFGSNEAEKMIFDNGGFADSIKAFSFLAKKWSYEFQGSSLEPLYDRMGIDLYAFATKITSLSNKIEQELENYEPR